MFTRVTGSVRLHTQWSKIHPMEHTSFFSYFHLLTPVKMGIIMPVVLNQVTKAFFGQAVNVSNSSIIQFIKWWNPSASHTYIYSFILKASTGNLSCKLTQDMYALYYGSSKFTDHITPNCDNILSGTIVSVYKKIFKLP
jgi:hypothetical protein